MRIGIIGWGSLIWDLDDLAPDVIGGWQVGAGPRMPLEFSRISPKRKMGLAVCLDPVNGWPCRTQVIRSARGRLPDAIADLARRERAPRDRIGFVTRSGAASRLPKVVQIARDWLPGSEWDAAVWTDLEPVFSAHTGRAFSIPAAIAYLHSLRGESLEEAHRYISEAPKATRTPLRDALAQDPWWQALSRQDL